MIKTHKQEVVEFGNIINEISACILQIYKKKIELRALEKTRTALLESVKKFVHTSTYTSDKFTLYWSWEVKGDNPDWHQQVETLNKKAIIEHYNLTGELPMGITINPRLNVRIKNELKS